MCSSPSTSGAREPRRGSTDLTSGPPRRQPASGEAPGVPFFEDIKKTNASLDGLHLTADPRLRVLDLTGHLVKADGTLDKDLYAPDAVHLVPAGYDVYAARLRPLLEEVLGPGGGEPATPDPASR